MIRKNTASDPQPVFDHLRSLVAEAENLLTRKGVALAEEEIEQIKRRFDAGIDRLREQYADMEDRVRAYWEEVENNIRTYYEDVERQLTRRVRAADRTIRRHPYRAMGVVFGAGVIVGALLGWRRE